MIQHFELLDVTSLRKLIRPILLTLPNVRKQDNHDCINSGQMRKLVLFSTEKVQWKTSADVMFYMQLYLAY